MLTEKYQENVTLSTYCYHHHCYCHYHYHYDVQSCNKLERDLSDLQEQMAENERTKAKLERELQKQKRMFPFVAESL